MENIDIKKVRFVLEPKTIDIIALLPTENGGYVNVITEEKITKQQYIDKYYYKLNWSYEGFLPFLENSTYYNLATTFNSFTMQEILFQVRGDFARNIAGIRNKGKKSLEEEDYNIEYDL